MMSSTKMGNRSSVVHGPKGEYVPHMSLGQLVYQQLRNFGNAIMEVDVQTGKQHTYSEILEKSIILAWFMKKYGVRVEDRVSIACENHPNYVIAMCATLFCGATWAPLNPAYIEREYRHMLEIYQPKLMFVSQRTEELMGKIAPTLSWTMKLIEIDSRSSNDQIITLDELLREYKRMVDPYTFDLVPIDNPSKRIAALLGSSGTTGFPKGVALSHRNLICFIYHSRAPDYLDVRKDDRVLQFLPMFHGYAFGMTLLTISVGSSIYIMRNFDVVTMMKTVDNYKITHLPLVPPILIILAKHPMVESYDFSSVRELICGAAPLPKDVGDEVKRRTKIKYIRNGYGMTELSIISNLSKRESIDNNVGPTMPGFQCKIVDPRTGKTLGIGEIGEVCYKGEQIMLGYYKNPKVTEETIDKENWCHTGDLGYLNEEEVLYITGRIKELIKYKGFQVSPSEIEAVMLMHPSIKEVAVIAKPDEVSGEVPIAFVLKQPNSNITTKEILKFTNDQLSPQKWVRGGVYFIANIPKTPSGKILRRELVTMIPKL